jgi:hypothetical protein
MISNLNDFSEHRHPKNVAVADFDALLSLENKRGDDQRNCALRPIDNG